MDFQKQCYASDMIYQLGVSIHACMSGAADLRYGVSVSELEGFVAGEMRVCGWAPHLFNSGLPITFELFNQIDQ